MSNYECPGCRKVASKDPCEHCGQDLAADDAAVILAKGHHRWLAENERLREALERIAVFYRGGERATESMLEMRAIARRALNASDDPREAGK